MENVRVMGSVPWQGARRTDSTGSHPQRQCTRCGLYRNVKYERNIELCRDCRDVLALMGETW